MIGGFGPKGPLGRLIHVVVLVCLGFSSAEVLWAEEGARTPFASAAEEPVSAAYPGASAPAAPDEERDDCPCMCACACANAQVVVLPERTTGDATLPGPKPSPLGRPVGPSHLLPEPLLPPPRS